MFMSHTLVHVGLSITFTGLQIVCVRVQRNKAQLSNSNLFIHQDLAFFVSLLSVSHAHCTLCVYFYLNKCDIYFLCFWRFCYSFFILMTVVLPRGHAVHDTESGFPPKIIGVVLSLLGAHTYRKLHYSTKKPEMAISWLLLLFPVVLQFSSQNQVD